MSDQCWQATSHTALIIKRTLIKGNRRQNSYSVGKLVWLEGTGITACFKRAWQPNSWKVYSSSGWKPGEPRIEACDQPAVVSQVPPPFLAPVQEIRTGGGQIYEPLEIEGSDIWRRASSLPPNRRTQMQEDRKKAWRGKSRWSLSSGTRGKPQ